ncbi:MAG: M13 family metallopeptidase [Gammaproteobacteria bacterium]|nr:M13 family metallopeptidase [Gammaproteobacteria bacterium]
MQQPARPAASLTLAGLAGLWLAGFCLAAVSDTGLDFAGIDRSVAPGDDFFRYANGNWLAKTAIPADQPDWGTFAVLTELTLKRTDELIRAAETTASPGSEARKIADYYASYMDAARIEQLGSTPLVPLLREIDAIADRTALARALGATLRADVDILNNTRLDTANTFGLWVAQDLSDPSHYSPFLLQGGLGMPDRDYYLNPSQKMADIRTQYQAHIAAVLRLAHIADAAAKARAIFELERRIAAVHVSRAESEDALKGNNHWSAAEFPRRAPGLEWPAFFAAAGLAQQREFVVWQPGAVTGIAALAGSAPLETWKDYLRFHLIDGVSGYLPQAFVAEDFSFREHVLSGTPEQEPRWKRAVEETNAALGEAVGKIYVAKYFPPAEKARAEAMVHNLIAAFAARIDRLEWMAPQTRARAKAKLETLEVAVGYPDHWRDFSGLEVRRGDAFGNARRAALFDYRYNLQKLGRPVDRGEWAMTPQLVNAVNLPALNAINFPAAILQPPNFDPQRDPVMDYGAIGSVIGHEISHSFDDQGALFDASGKLQNWWTPEDFAHFKAAGERLVEQFNAYHPFPDINVNGRQTLSENIADVAGLADSFDAWRLTLQGRMPPAIAGFSGEQLFFLSYGQSKRRKFREAALRLHVVTDGHAPAEYRADTVRNLDAWYQAFQVTPSQKLYLSPPDRVGVW